ncbi:MAG: DHA2 family efflux MFS transporter permease subunit [Acidiferrobacterales bacterium]
MSDAVASGSGSESSRRFLISLAVMSATVLQALDTTIVNVALPHMQGQLGATPDQISWVLTSYLVASGICMPLTGYFADRLGQKNFLLISILGFVVSSALCGISTNLAEIVLFRLLQGVFGAALVPMSQSIMVQTFPHEERGKAMAIWGIGVMVGPILGPTLGGYITEVLSWRWTFYINLPVGALSLFLAWRMVPDSPRRERRMDWLGLLLMSLAVGGLQFVLDRGAQDDWFSSWSIRFATALSVASLVGFLYHGLMHPRKALFDPHIFRDRNFATASLLLAVFGLGMYGAMVLQPMMLENLLNYPTSTTGLIMAPRGIASMISMMLVGRLISRVEPRALIAFGIVLSAIGSYAMTMYNLDIDSWWLVWPVVVQGLGLGMIFVPLSTVAFATLPKEQSAEAAGIYSLMRTIGSSIGISIATTVMTRNVQVAWNQIGGHITVYNQAISSYLQGLNLTLTDPAAIAVLAQSLARQAQMVGMLDAFKLISWSVIAMLPMVLLIGRSSRKGGSEEALAAAIE